ncbi:MAG: DUF1697 domain-containing protein [Salinimicrobium sp.]
MRKFVAILRGLNVGGERKLPMDELKELFLKLGYSKVRTIMQSGNVIFEAEAKEEEISKAVENAIFETYNFKVPVICRSAEDLQKSVTENPFFEDAAAELERLHLTFLKELPESKKLEKLKEYNFYPDEFLVREKNIFIYCSGKYSDSELSNTFFEEKLKVPATTRKWETVLKLAELV